MPTATFYTKRALPKSPKNICQEVSCRAVLCGMCCYSLRVSEVTSRYGLYYTASI